MASFALPSKPVIRPVQPDSAYYQGQTVSRLHRKSRYFSGILRGMGALVLFCGEGSEAICSYRSRHLRRSENFLVGNGRP